MWETEPTQSMEQLYHAAVIDSVTAEDDEVLPLVSITGDSDMVTWRDGKILLLTINRRPERYIAGEALTLPGEVWTFTDRWSNTPIPLTNLLSGWKGVKPSDNTASRRCAVSSFLSAAFTNAACI